MIERYQLRYFLAVVDAGNFSRAAAQVNVTQPALSLAIAKLEAELGAKVFRRNSQRVHLTDEGVRLLTKARAIEGEFNSLAGGLTEQAPRPLLRLGVLSTIPTRLIVDVVLASADEPLEIVEGAERDLIGRLNTKRIDLALTIIRPGEPRFHAETLFTEGYSIIMPKTHALADCGVAPGESFAKETMIVRRHCEILSETSRYFTDRGVRPRFSFRSTNDDRTLSLVKAGLGVTIMPDSHLDEDLAAVKLAGFNHRRTIGLLFADEINPTRPSPIVSALRRLQTAPRACLRGDTQLVG